jgi:hypothetical protein
MATHPPRCNCSDRNLCVDGDPFDHGDRARQTVLLPVPSARYPRAQLASRAEADRLRHGRLPSRRPNNWANVRTTNLQIRCGMSGDGHLLQSRGRREAGARPNSRPTRVRRCISFLRAVDRSLTVRCVLGQTVKKVQHCEKKLSGPNRGVPLAGRSASAIRVRRQLASRGVADPRWSLETCPGSTGTEQRFSRCPARSTRAGRRLSEHLNSPSRLRASDDEYRRAFSDRAHCQNGRQSTVFESKARYSIAAVRLGTTLPPRCAMGSKNQAS